MRKPRFSIRTLLIATFFFALLLAAWINPPSGYIDVRLERGGKLTVNGEVVAMADLQSSLTWKHRWLSIWHRKPRAYDTPRSVLNHINGFLMECKISFDIKAIYLPHNGFVFNNDRWYFDSNAYDVANDIATDYEWLCHPRSIEWESFTLTGLEKAQEDFEWYVNEERFDDEKWESIAAIAELLAKVRFVQLIASALTSSSPALPVPVITTAYGFDFFCRFDP